MSDLPVNIDSSYPDGLDPSRKVHQQHHDALHALYNIMRLSVPWFVLGEVPATVVAPYFTIDAADDGAVYYENGL